MSLKFITISRFFFINSAINYEYLCRMVAKQWFSSWFDTEFYHILYKDRNESEAQHFIAQLTDYLKLPKEKLIVDLACGKGRHSITLNKLGFNVLGVDLSSNSIMEASKHSNEHLKFRVHDMRLPIANIQCQAVFNLFTSFGYFDSMKDNEQVLNSIHEILIDDGVLVIDFLNATKTINELVETEEKKLEGITFNIKRLFDGTHIFKHIDFQSENIDYSYTERVQALSLEDFQLLFQKSGFELFRTFGDFNLEDYNAEKSNRLIMLARKV